MQERLILFAIISIFFFSCKQKEKNEDLAEWKAKGDSLATKTFDTLRNTLMRAVGEKGFPGAVDFCNTAALGLTHTYGSEAILVKRTSDRLRNPSNAPDSMEQRIMAAYRQRKDQQKEMQAIVETDAAGDHHYFKPILLQAMCLNCHGEKEIQIKSATWDMIRQKYPADAAFNYKDGDLRGIWHITFLQSGK